MITTEATYDTPSMARSYGVDRGGSAAEFSHSTGQYKMRAELPNPPDP
jgi:hypothetical protein